MSGQKKIVASGKRKRAIAKAKISEGQGDIRINKESYQKLNVLDRLRLEEPLRIAKDVLGKTNFDVEITVQGGGEKGQIEAVRLALARAISEFSGWRRKGANRSS